MIFFHRWITASSLMRRNVSFQRADMDDKDCAEGRESSGARGIRESGSEDIGVGVALKGT